MKDTNFSFFICMMDQYCAGFEDHYKKLNEIMHSQISRDLSHPIETNKKISELLDTTTTELALTYANMLKITALLSCFPEAGAVWLSEKENMETITRYAAMAGEVPDLAKLLFT